MAPLVTRLAAAALIFASFPSAAQEFRLEPVLSGLSSPLGFTDPGDHSRRAFIAERGGVIRLRQPGASTTSVFLDITSRVLSGGERGLLGLAFHPRYEENGRFFVNYTRQPDGATVVAEYHVSGHPNIASPDETPLIVISQPFENHNGGMLAFGPDGYLYIGMGDGGSGNDPGNRAQNINELLGKMLRIDVDGARPYASPATNPFAGATAGRDEIWATGLRNPWRFSFDRGTGDLYIADVGQGSWEEINHQPAASDGGENYGWRVYEGTHCTGIDPCSSAGKTFPIIEYGHSAGRCSVTGGYAYRGITGVVPAGTYIYGDFCSGEIFRRSPDGSGSLLLDTTINIASFGEDESGEIYVVGLGGTVHRLVGSQGSAPEIGPTGSPSATVGATLRLQLTAADADGQAVSFSAGSLPAGAALDPAGLFRWRPAVDQVGTHEITFTATDSSGLASSASLAVPVHPLVAAGDFNGDGRSDVVLRHPDTSEIGLWFMNGTAIASGARIASTGGASVAGAGDFDGDGVTDLLLRDASGGLGVWMMSGETITLGAALPASGTSTVVGVADFDGDGSADILLRDRSGSLGLWRMNGTAVLTGHFVGSPAGYDVVAIADFNGDARADLLLRDLSGNVGMWLMNGARIESGGFVARAGASTVVAAADFNGDGRADIVLRDTLGGIGLWMMNGPMISSGHYVAAAPDYHVANAADYDGAGTADLLLRHSGTGEVAVWIMQGAAIVAANIVGTPGTTYDVQ